MPKKFCLKNQKVFQMKQNNDWIVIFSTSFAPTAEYVESMLADNGIECVVLTGENPYFDTNIEVLIPEHESEKAQEILTTGEQDEESD
jgi:hypothetical protein